MRGEFDDAEDFEGDIQTSGFDKTTGDHNYVRQTLMNDPTGPFTNAGGDFGSGTRVIERHLVDRVVYIEHACTTFEAIPALLLALCRPTEGSLLNLIEYGLPLPDSCYIRAYPWIRFTTEGIQWII